MVIKTVHVNVRRLDINEPEKYFMLEIESDITFLQFKEKVFKLLNVSDTEDKILKIRNSESILVPLSELIESSTPERPFIIDITKIHNEIPVISCSSPLHYVYVDAIRDRIKHVESRISRVESLVPQLKWRRHSLLEQTTHSLSSRVAFLDRRIDELTPVQWNEHIKNSSTLPPLPLSHT